MRTKFLTLFVLLLLCAGGIQAESVFVENYSFELPGTGKINNDWGSIPGWSSDMPPADSGVEQSGWVTPTDGDWTGFLMGGDPNVWQVTNSVIEAGQVYELRVDVIVSYFADAFTMALFYDNDGQRVWVASSTVAITDQWQTFSLIFNADDVPASIGKRIGIEFLNPASNWLAMDNARLDILYAGLITPSPNGVENVAIDTNLVWTNNHGWNVDVYLSGPYNDPNPAPVLSKVVSNQSATNYNSPVNLQNNAWYYWRVDAREPNIVGDMQDIIHEGPIWSFKTIRAEPIITFNNVITTLDLLPAAMSAIILNPGTSVTFTLLEDDFEYPAGATATLTPDVSNPGAPTLTVDADMPGIYKIKLTVSSSLGDKEAIAEVMVYADFCQAKKDAPSGWVRNYYDRDSDCDVDMDDLTDFALEWLDNTGLSAPMTYKGVVEYIPVTSVVELINPGFELPGTGKIKNNWGLIPGWSSDTNPTDSGVETNSAATDGIYVAFLRDSDPPVWQTTSHTIVGNEKFELSFDAQNTSALAASLYYVDGGSRVILTTQNFDVSGMNRYMVTFDVSTVPAAAGKLLGVLFDNAGSGWCQFDRVSLEK